MIADDIRNARTEEVIYFLLTAYIDIVRSGDKPSSVPEHISRLPIRGIVDVGMRFEKLVSELDAASKQLNDEACVEIREALHIFSAALNRLRSLRRSGKVKPLLAHNDGKSFPVPAADQADTRVDVRGVANF